MIVQNYQKGLVNPHIYHLPNGTKNGKIFLITAMKKLLVTFCIITLVCCLCAPTFCMAQTSAAQKTRYYQTITVTDGTNPTGVRFVGEFFGKSGIMVVVDVYSSANFVVDFDFNNQTNLTTEQLATKQKVKQLFDEFYDFIMQIDFLSNANYDGKDYFLGSGENKVVPPQSEVHRYNQLQTGVMEISKHTYNMLKIAQDMYTVTNGAYNPAVYRLVDLWGFSSRIYSEGRFGLPYDRQVSANEFWTNGYPLPEDKYVEAFSNSQFVSFSPQSVQLSATQNNGVTTYTVTKNVQPVTVDGVAFTQWIDLGGIAKGYAADFINGQLKQNGIDSFRVDLGTSSQSYGKGLGGEPSKLLLQDPFETISYAFGVQIENANLSTSGLNNRKYTTNGVTYSHIIDGKSGAPVQTGIEGATVISPTLSAAECDCLTTAITVMGRNALVDFVNSDFAKTHNLQIAGFYKTLQGAKQIISNIAKNSVFTTEFCSLDSFGWAMNKNDQGNFVYDEQVVAQNPNKVDYTTAIIILAVVVVLALAGVLVYHFLRGKRKIASRIAEAKKDKFFKPADAFVYVCVALVIVLLFGVFLSKPTAQLKVVKVVDMQTEEVLFVYNVARKEFQYLSENVNGWSIEVQQNGDVVVNLSKMHNGEQVSNQLTIFQKDGNVTVKMTHSVCGYHQDCVRNFDEMSHAGQSIVCSPNMLKIITE